MDPALVQQIMGGGPLLEQQSANEQDLMDMIARRKAAAATPYSTGGGALLGAIANVILGRKEAGLREKRDSLAQQMAGVRGAYGNAFVGQPAQSTANPAEQAFYGTPQTMNAPSPEEQSRLAAMGELSGDPVMAKFGAGVMARAQQAPKLAFETEQMRHLQQENNAMETPQAGAATRILLSRFGLQAPEGTPNAAMRALLPYAEKGAAALQDQYAVNPLTGSLFNKKTGKSQGGSGGTVGLSGPALDQAAQLFHTTGQLPSVGQGAAGAIARRQILNRVGELFPDANIASNKAGYHADQGSLAKAQTQADAIESFENTALKNLDQFQQVARNVVDVGSPLFNAPLRSIANKIGGSEKQAQFNAARQVAVQEIGKVLGGAVMGGAITDSQRGEVQSLLNGDLSLAQIEAVSQTLKQDMANRKAAVNEQLKTIRGRISGKPAEGGSAPKRRVYDPVSGTLKDGP